MKLTYWYAEILDDAHCYSIRKRTKKEAKAERDIQPERFGPIRKIVVEYKDGFDLLDQCLNEGGLIAEVYGGD